LVQEDLAMAEPIHPNLAIFSSFAKFAALDPLVISPAVRSGAPSGGNEEGGEETDEEGGSQCTLAEGEQQQLMQTLQEYYAKVSQSLVRAWGQLRAVEKSNQKTLLNKGELSEEAAATHEKARKLHEKLHTGCASISEALGQELPTLVDEEEAKKEKVVISLYGANDQDDSEEVFEDADTRAFYEQLPDLKSVLPAVLFEDPSERGASVEAVDDDSAARFEALLAELPLCTSRERCDELASEMCGKGLRSHRRKLVKALTSPPRDRTEVLRCYCRIAATLSLCFKFIGPELASLVQEDFNELNDQKGAAQMAARLHNATFLGELCKFRLLPSPAVFACLKKLLDDFSPPQVEVLCHLLETCGRYLYRHRDTHSRCDAMLELIIKMRSVHRLPGEVLSHLENAIYTCRPPEQTIMQLEERTPLHQYIIALLHHQLNKQSVEKVIRQLRKLPWSDPEVEGWFVEAILSCAEVKYHAIGLVACVASGLLKYQERVVLRVVDAAVERLRVALDRNDHRQLQSRTCLTKLVGELYAYRLLDSTAIMRVLYMMVPRASGIWGNVVPLTHVPAHIASRLGAEPTARPVMHPGEPMLDGPEDMNRLRMVLALLDTVAGFFKEGASKRKLDVFLVYLCRYLFCKALTIDVQFALADTLQAVRPSLVRPPSYAAACEAVEQLEAAIDEDPRHGSALAHELLHAKTTEAEEEDTEGEDGDEDGDGDEDDEVDRELAELEEQLRELEVDEEREPQEEEESYTVASQQRREATQEEQAAFEKEMQGVYEQSREAARKASRAPTEGIKIPHTLFHSGGGAGGVGVVAEGAAEGSALTLRVMCKRGDKKSKIEAAEVQVPVEDTLARTVLKMESLATQERQRLKRQILAAAADHETATGGHIAQIRQNAANPQETTPRTDKPRTRK